MTPDCPLRLVFLCRRDHPLVDRMRNGMGRRSRMPTASTADLAVTVLGVAGLLGFLMAGRMETRTRLHSIFSSLFGFLHSAASS
jgi:hypothetical protein